MQLFQDQVPEELLRVFQGWTTLWGCLWVHLLFQHRGVRLPPEEEETEESDCLWMQMPEKSVPQKLLRVPPRRQKVWARVPMRRLSQRPRVRHCGRVSGRVFWDSQESAPGTRAEVPETGDAAQQLQSHSLINITLLCFALFPPKRILCFLFFKKLLFFVSTEISFKVKQSETTKQMFRFFWIIVFHRTNDQIEQNFQRNHFRTFKENKNLWNHFESFKFNVSTKEKYIFGEQTFSFSLFLFGNRWTLFSDAFESVRRLGFLCIFQKGKLFGSDVGFLVRSPKCFAESVGEIVDDHARRCEQFVSHRLFIANVFLLLLLISENDPSCYLISFFLGFKGFYPNFDMSYCWKFANGEHLFRELVHDKLQLAEGIETDEFDLYPSAWDGGCQFHELLSVHLSLLPILVQTHLFIIKVFFQSDW